MEGGIADLVHRYYSRLAAEPCPGNKYDPHGRSRAFFSDPFFITVGIDTNLTQRDMREGLRSITVTAEADPTEKSIAVIIGAMCHLAAFYHEGPLVLEVDPGERMGPGEQYRLEATAPRYAEHGNVRAYQGNFEKVCRAITEGGGGFTHLYPAALNPGSQKTHLLVTHAGSSLALRHGVVDSQTGIEAYAGHLDSALIAIPYSSRRS